MGIFNKNENEWSVPASILVGSVIIAASIFLSLNGSGSSNRGTQNAGQQSNDTPPEQVDVAKRKDAPTLGSGKVEIVVFSDFQCPFCQSFWAGAYKQIKEKYVDTGKAKLVFRHFPLPIHQFAEKAAEASECAYKQGKFSEYHDTLFASTRSDGSGLSTTDLKKYAVNLGLDAQKFNQCLDSGETANIVKSDIADGEKAQVNGTPTIFINGKRVVGALPFAEFEKVIEAEL